LGSNGGRHHVRARHRRLPEPPVRHRPRRRQQRQPARGTMGSSPSWTSP